VLWIIRDCLSGEILLARALLSSTQGDLTALLQAVKDRLPVPVRGIISDGQETIRSAVAFVFPNIPHQLCQFHYLRDAAQPIFEADRHVKTLLKSQVRGIRPIERALEERNDSETEAIRDYCLAVRSPMTGVRRSQLQGSSCMIGSLRSATPLGELKKKRATPPVVKAVAASLSPWFTGNSFSVAPAHARLWMGSSSCSYSRQS